MSLDTRKNDQFALDSAAAEGQQDLDLAESEQDLPLQVQEKRRKGSLRTGFTTGTSATAATKAALLALLSNKAVDYVSVSLPKDTIMKIEIESTNIKEQHATASVIKDAGDDPDVTDSAEIRSTVHLTKEVGTISIDGGEGVGRVTKPGLGLGIGKAAINPSPIKMIQKAVNEVAAEYLKSHGIKIIISVPRGEEIARKTDNPRLGIIGGISILGTTGIVIPYSTASFAASIRQSLDVALAMGDNWVILTTGGRSEDFAKVLFERTVPEHCFVQIGDFAGYSIRQCVQKKIRKATIAGFIGKLTKMSMGVKQTHVRGSHVNMEFMARLASECLPTISGSLLEEIKNANTARHVFEIIAASGITGFSDLVCKKVYEHMHEYSKGELQIEVILFDFDGKVSGQFPGLHSRSKDSP